MIQRIALLAGGLGAAAVLALALGAGNLLTFGAGQPIAKADSQAAVVDATPADTTISVAQDQNVQPEQTRTRTVVDKVYIAPTPPPKVIRETKTAPSTQPAPTPKTNSTPPPAAPPRAHDDGGHDDGRASQESEHESGHHGHERGDD